MDVGSQCRSPAASPAVKEPTAPRNRRLSGAHRRSGRFGEGENLLLPPEIAPLTFEPLTYSL